MNADILDKVRKLRALSQSDNVNEAAAAARLAEKLIQEHNLSEAQLADPDQDDMVTRDLLAGEAGATWKGSLLASLAKAYQCKVVRSGKNFHMFGRPQDIETLKYQYAFFTLEIERMCRKLTRGMGRTGANSFRMGAVIAIANALTEVTREIRAQASSNALVIVDKRALRADAAKNTAFPSTRTSPSRFRVNDEAFAMGKRAGANMNQRTQIGAGGSRLLGC